MTEDQIRGEADRDPLADMCLQAISNSIYAPQELLERFDSIQKIIETSFDQAVDEPKIKSREALILSNSASLSNLRPNSKPSPSGMPDAMPTPHLMPDANTDPSTKRSTDNMRRHMTKVYDELLCENEDIIYIGEDVEHGGYYLVTDGLAKKYPYR
jgi:hypothetical protein